MPHHNALANFESNFPSAYAMADIAATTNEASLQWSTDLNTAWALPSRREILAARIKACEAMRERLQQIEADTRVYVALCDAVAAPEGGMERESEPADASETV